MRICERAGCEAEVRVARTGVFPRVPQARFCSARCRKTVGSELYRTRHPERMTAAVTRYQAAHPGIVMEERRRRQHRDPVAFARQMRLQRLRRLYNMSEADYDALFAAQGGLCSICREPEKRTRRGALQPLSIDHDHETGAVRGLLCARCNSVLGWIESPGRLDAALAYLSSARERQGKVA